MRTVRLALPALLLGCTPSIPTDAAAPVDTAPDADTTGEVCDPLAFRIDGPDAPRIGDTWTILLTCDGDVATGAMRIAFDPPDFVSWEDEIYATFREAGSATLIGQVGTVRETMDVTVSR
jgi:hypothetical protein